MTLQQTGGITWTLKSFAWTPSILKKLRDQRLCQY